MGGTVGGSGPGRVWSAMRMMVRESFGTYQSNAAVRNGDSGPKRPAEPSLSPAALCVQMEGGNPGVVHQGATLKVGPLTLEVRWEQRQEMIQEVA